MKSLITSLLIGLLITISLFWLMQYMLLGHPEKVRKSENLNMMEFVRLIREPPPKPKPKPPQEKKVEKVQEVVQEKPKPAPKKPTPQKPKVEKVVQKAPPQPMPKFDMPKLDLPMTNLSNSNAPMVRSTPPSPPAAKPAVKPSNSGSGSPHGTGQNSGGVSSGVVAIVRVPPKYPASAARRNIEGWVKVEFTITTVGSVSNPRVVAAEPEDIFDDAALAAISQWKFKEKIVDGQAVTQRAVQTLRFKLTN